MAGSRKVLDSFTGIVATGTRNLGGTGGHASATFLVRITAITRTTGTLDVAVRTRFDAVGTSLITIASVTGITATGLFPLVLTSDFNADQMAIMEPNALTLTINGDATDVAGTLIAIYGD